MKKVGIIVTFRRLDLLNRNIEACLSQTEPLDKLIIVDNHSCDGTVDKLHELYDNNSSILIHELQDNTGGAGGFSSGLKFAYELGFDICIMMDDDGYPFKSNTFELLFKKYEEVYHENEPVLLNSLVVCDTDNLSFGLLDDINTVNDASLKAKEGLIKGTCNPFNGTLVNNVLVEKIGFPNEKFFIRFDEIDYYRRALRANAFVATVVDSIYYHPSTAKCEVRKVCGINFVNEYEQPWKEYYKVRNKFYLYRQDKKGRIWMFFKYLQYKWGTSVFKISNKKNVLRMIRLGYKHSKQGKLGRVINPGQNTF